MLNIGVNISFDVSEYHYPIHFEKRNECVHCGAVGQLTFVDIFGNETNKEIHPFDHIKCKACGTKYSILWNRDETTNKMIPCAVDQSFKQEVINLANRKKIKENGEKTL